VLAVAGRDGERRLTKPLLMPLLMPGRSRATQRALALSWAGDIALLGSGDAAFGAGLASFLASHLAWIAALREQPGGRLRARPALAIPPVAAAAALNAWLWPRTGAFRIPVVLYSVVLEVMALTALDRESPAAGAGGMLFLASDSLLALRAFGGMELPAGDGLVMATYAAAQALLAESTDEVAQRACQARSSSASRSGDIPTSLDGVGDTASAAWISAID
jgi:uncharacterized membrane protein YhhN